MGYNTRVTGEIEIRPPLKWSEFKDSPFYVSNPYGSDRCVRLRVETDARDTDDGQLTIKTAVALVPSWEEASKYYELGDHVQEAVDAFAAKGRAFTGHFECVGEEQPDMWRLYVRKGRVTEVRAAVVWPEDVADLDDALRTNNPHHVDEAAQRLMDKLDAAFKSGR